MAPVDGYRERGQPTACWAVTRAGFLVVLAACLWSPGARAERNAPNFVVIVADDLGRGDLGSYGGASIRTPGLDRMASEGVRLTEFYTPAPTCSPARAALLTGRHPLRTGVTRVFVPKEMQGLPASEITLAEQLKRVGYRTACIGKWHLGGRAPYRPEKHGFDEFFGVLYSNNMVWLRRLSWPRLELFDGRESIESPADTSLLTRRYTHRAIQFLKRSAGKPFFLYLAYTMPHIPLAASREFSGLSAHGPYGDVVEEIDASVAHLLASLETAGLAERTYVVFTSDNGPWPGDAVTRGGSTGGLRGFKGTTWDGGLRIPMIVWAPGRLPAGGVRQGAATLLDLFPTISALAGAELPVDREYDGSDILPLLRGSAPAPARDLYFSNRSKVHAVRSGAWKVHLRERALGREGRPRKPRALDPPQLYHLGRDPREEIDVAESHPDVVSRLKASAEGFQEGIKPTIKLHPIGQAIARGLLFPVRWSPPTSQGTDR